MKKQLLLFVMMLLPMVAIAYDAQINGIYYNFSGNEATVTYQSWGAHPVPGNGNAGHSDYAGRIIIPETVSYNGIEYSVTSIGRDAFFGSAGLTGVSIPNSVKTIGERAFCYCTSLTDVNIPNTIKSIEWATFSGCSSLNNVSIPNSVRSIEEYTFSLRTLYNDKTSFSLP